ncbi:MAG TPA: GntR family transcriptional regulator, partial [Alphaproteobacteria bacterium]|nr:GntR family transcriptional regulator [Alphaproteobacteria bacterium]
MRPDTDVQPLRGSLGEAAFERLREGIAGGKWAPGERLPSERALAARLAISRPALREAV